MSEDVYKRQHTYSSGPTSISEPVSRFCHYHRYTFPEWKFFSFARLVNRVVSLRSLAYNNKGTRDRKVQEARRFCRLLSSNKLLRPMRSLLWSSVYPTAKETYVLPYDTWFTSARTHFQLFSKLEVCDISRLQCTNSYWTVASGFTVNERLRGKNTVQWK